MNSLGSFGLLEHFITLEKDNLKCKLSVWIQYFG